MDNAFRRRLEKQGYRFLGEHSAIKTCDWTRKSLIGEGVCYKEKFYGISCHRCAQISVSVNFCDMNCIYCWREHRNFPFTIIDEPQDILDRIADARKDLVAGIGGHRNADRKKVKEALNVKHIAISLTGETLYYPKLNELIREISRRGMTSFVVTNGSRPDILEKLENPTQLYLSLDSYNKELFQKVCRPLSDDMWKKVMKSLDVLAEKKCKTCIRLTLIRGINMSKPEEYAGLISRGKPDFAEVKAFMLVGAARERLTIDNMPFHDEIKKFAEEICRHCDYSVVDEQEESRVVLCAKKKH